MERYCEVLRLTLLKPELQEIVALVSSFSPKPLSEDKRKMRLSFTSINALQHCWSYTASEGLGVAPNSRILSRALSTRYPGSCPSSTGSNVFLQVHHGVCNALQWTHSSPICRSICGKRRDSTSELTCLFDTVGWVYNHCYSKLLVFF